MTYKIDSLKFGTEDNLLIYVDMNSTSYHNIKDGEEAIKVQCVCVIYCIAGRVFISKNITSTKIKLIEIKYVTS